MLKKDNLYEFTVSVRPGKDVQLDDDIGPRGSFYTALEYFLGLYGLNLVGKTQPVHVPSRIECMSETCAYVDALGYCKAALVVGEDPVISDEYDSGCSLYTGKDIV